MGNVINKILQVIGAVFLIIIVGVALGILVGTLIGSIGDSKDNEDDAESDVDSASADILDIDIPTIFICDGADEFVVL